MKKVYLFLIAVMFTHLALAQVMLTGSSGSYSQNFDGFGLVDRSTSYLANWVFSPSSPPTYETLVYDNGNDAQGRFYNYGTVNNSDRALGMQTSNSFLNAYVGVRLKRDIASTSAISELTISYSAEMWRQNTRNQGIEVSYSLNSGGSITSGNWVDISALSVSFPAINTPTTRNGNDLNNRANKTVNLSVNLEPGDEIVIRFHKNGNNSHGLGIDDFQIDWVEPLPIDLLSFTGQAQKTGNALEWVTANEKDFSHFELEWSNDNAKEFNVLSSIPASDVANNDFQKHYSFNHAVEGGLHYYRLKQVDLNGDMSYSKVIKVNRDFEASCEFAVVPNPIVGNQLIINANQSFSGRLIITDLSGKEVYSESIASAVLQHRVDVTHLNTGVYYLSIKTPSEEKVLKFMK